jgi:hypothetical protein
MLLRLRCILALLFCLVLFRGGSLAQEFRATVQGTISDQSGASVPGANVVLTNIGTGVESRASTNAAGLYAFQFRSTPCALAFTRSTPASSCGTFAW